MPHFEPSESSAVSYMRYDRPHRRLYVTFRESGDMYVYLDVAPPTYDGLLAAESKGRFLNEKIKDHYKFVHLKRAS